MMACFCVDYNNHYYKSQLCAKFIAVTLGKFSVKYYSVTITIEDIAFQFDVFRKQDEIIFIIKKYCKQTT